MRKLSQKELLQEGFASLLKDVGKGILKRGLPATYKLASGAKGLYKKHFDSASKTVESLTRSKPEVFGEVSKIEEKELQKGVYEVNFIAPIRNIQAGTESEPVSMQAKVVKDDKGFRLISLKATSSISPEIKAILRSVNITKTTTDTKKTKKVR